MHTADKKTLYTIGVSLILALLLLFFSPCFKFYIQYFNGKTYDLLASTELKFRPLPVAINDIVLIGIDNPTVMHMPFRWPYPRTVFAKVVTNLKNAGAKVIAFDFVFLGRSEIADEDTQLKNALTEASVIMPTSIDEEGNIELYSNNSVCEAASSGIITKITDADGVIRKKFCYLVNSQDPNKAYLSWGMQILKKIKDIDLSTFNAQGASLSFENRAGEKWEIPVDQRTKSFLIRFRGHTFDFNRISFYKAFLGEFNPAQVKNKIVLVGFISTVFADIHNTPIGWLPGLTLNANGFLTLYARDFLKNVPWYLEMLIILLGVVLNAFFVSILHIRKSLIYVSFFGMGIFYLLSYLLLTHNYIWSYTLFPLATIPCPFLGKKIVDFIAKVCFNT